MPVEARQKRILHPLLLWAGWLIGPLAWALHLVVSYVLLAWVCASGHHWILHAITLVTLAMSLAGVWLAWRQWSAAGRQWPGSGDRQMSRIRFMAIGGLILGVLSALLIVAEGIPNFFFGACL
ncbi:hypothetical protein R5M92_02070 [Halomonas sp. Bachu 37]|uniref:hypothetical protein n=1 Tax=Halomonas kashgarensis TaxID=3084920 RepID=UPI0032169A5E